MLGCTQVNIQQLSWGELLASAPIHDEGSMKGIFILTIYSDAMQVDSKVELPAGSEEECEIRAASIVAVEMLKDLANVELELQQRRLQQGQVQQQQQPRCSPGVLSIQVGIVMATLLIVHRCRHC